MVCAPGLINVLVKIMIRQLNKITDQLDRVILAMDESNMLMKKLTKQLEIISLPPDMVKWAKEMKK